MGTVVSIKVKSETGTREEKKHLDMSITCILKIRELVDIKSRVPYFWSKLKRFFPRIDFSEYKDRKTEISLLPKNEFIESYESMEVIKERRSLVRFRVTVFLVLCTSLLPEITMWVSK